MTSFKKTYYFYFILLSFVLILFCFVNLSLGSVTIPLEEILSILVGKTSSKASWETIIINYRLPKTITAVLVGSGLSVCGLLMQTLFRNPLAGPFVLGISSGASLGVALFVLGSGFISSLWGLSILDLGLPLAASLGAFFVLIAIILAANKVRNTMSILIIGLMFGALTSSIINVLSYFSEAEQLKQFVFWGFGSLGNLTWNEIFIFLGIYFICGIGIFTSIKALNSFLLGENYAQSLGINTKKSRNIIFIITSILTGIITAFCGPIAFIGLAVPHITKLIFKTSNHKVLIPAVVITGAIILLICDTIAQLPRYEFTLPINAITSLFGAPVVIWLLVRKKKIYV
ncbi:FecCD family ABC transporter permease [Tenacibaculum jejuense]|uniref:Iron transport system permease n=1 Tax=Tenacibaculum jejuense TaxID=584609 RepID=A0A238UCD7_9FLAO|nr:iron ABC transporter permease [Tenacibaculum jejuense]SNR16873.1 Iron transport system permease [Tenacibaculum jejuense]